MLRKTYIRSERVEECAVWIVLKPLVDLELPDDTAGTIQVDKLKGLGVLGGVPHKGQGTLEAGIGPLIWLGVCVVDASKGGE